MSVEHFTNKTLDALTLLSNSGQELSAITDLDELLKKIMEITKHITNSDASSILLLDSATNELYFKIALGEKGEKIKWMRFPADQGIAGWVATNKKSLIVDDVKKDPRHLGAIDEKSTYQTKSLACVPVVSENELIGVIQALNKSDEQKYTDEDIKYLTILASQAAVAIHNARVMKNLQNFYINMVEFMVNSIESATPTPKGHCLRVARTATSIARKLGITGKEYENIYYASMVHDIGKISLAKMPIADIEVLHPQAGSSLFSQIAIFKDIAPLIEAHHERIDGSGFPNMLTGNDMTLAAKILSFAEAYEHWKEEMEEKGDLGHSYYNFISTNSKGFEGLVIDAFIKANEE